MAAVLLGVFVLVLLIGAPVAVAMGMGALAAILWEGRFPPLILAQRMFAGIDSFPLMAVPFFILAAELMTGGRITDAMLALARQMVGRVRGGLGHANVLLSVLFSGVSGSALADAAGPGSVTIRMMRDGGYRPEYAAAVTASSAIVSSIIPPSIIMVIYSLTENSVSLMTLFMAGVIPGLLIALSLMAMNAFLAWRHGFERGAPRRPWSRFWRENGVAFAAVPLPVIILGGIHGGIFTPTEAAAVASVYAFVVARFLLKSLEWAAIPRILIRTGMMTSAVLLIVATASAFAWLLTVAQVPQTIARMVVGWGLSPLALLATIAVMLVICGLVIDTLPGVLLFVPIVAPIAIGAGIDPVQVGMVIVTALAIGMITPPVGGVLFVVSVVGNIPLPGVIRAILPFLFAELCVLAALVLWPGLSTWLPAQLGYISR